MATKSGMDAWKSQVRVEVARLLNRSLARLPMDGRQRMFALTNAPEWVAFLNQSWSQGLSDKTAAAEFIARFDIKKG